VSTSAKAITAIKTALKYALIAWVLVFGVYAFYISFGLSGALVATCIGLMAVLLEFLSSVEGKR